MSETTLWTNPNISASFASADVTLSESIQNFDYIGFDIAQSTSVSTTNRTIMSVADFALTTTGSASSRNVGFSGGSTWVRYAFRKGSDTIVGFSSCQNKNSAGNQNDKLIPIKIVGLK